MTKKSIVFLSIFFVSAVLIAGGVLWYGEKVQREERMAQQQIEEQQRQRETAKEQSPQTLQDLVDRSETITLPEVDTSKWTGYYRNEQLGIEFQYPKEEGWKILDEKDGEIYKDSVCVGNTKYTNIAKYGHSLMEGASDCIVQIDNLVLVDQREIDLVKRVLQWESSFYRINLLNFEKDFLATENGYHLSQRVGERNLLRISLSPLARVVNVSSINNAYYGILQALKPIQE